MDQRIGRKGGIGANRGKTQITNECLSGVTTTHNNTEHDIRMTPNVLKIHLQAPNAQCVARVARGTHKAYLSRQA